MELRQDNFGFLISDVYRLLRRVFQKRLEGSSPLTLAQAQALMCVSRNEGARQVELAELIDVQPITLARLIDQLVEAGAVERRPDPRDRRAHRVYLTEGAAPHLEAIRQVGAGIRKEALQGLTDAQIDTVLYALDSMRDRLMSRD